MTTMLCASCQHTFPEDMLTPASFSTRVGRYLSRTSALLRETRGKSSEDDHRLAQVSQLVQQLCGAVQEEVQVLQERQHDAAPGQPSSSAAAQTRTGQQQQQQQQQHQHQQAIKRRSAGSLAAAVSGGGFRSLGTSDLRGPADSSTRLPYVVNPAAFASPPPASMRVMFEGSVPPYQMKRMVTALDLVSATLFTMLESLAVQCRAHVALLWLRPRQNLSSSELVAPFVVGRDLSSLANSAPYTTLESSIPCVVCQTGVAINLQPQPHVHNATQTAVSDLTLTELMEHTNAAQLLTPVHDRYAERQVATRASTVGPPPVMAVVHLIGSPINPVPFHRHNEEAIAQTATLLSSIISSYYDTMIAEWTNRFYVPTTLHATGRYAAALDLRAEEKVMDDFAAPPLLIYRTAVSNLSERTSANEARDALKLLGQNAARKAVPLRPMVSVKDLCTHATAMEANWVSAVQQTTRLEKAVDVLEEDLLRRDVSVLQRAQEARRPRGSSAEKRRFGQPAMSAPAPGAVQVAPVPPPTVSKARASLSSADIKVSLTPPVPYVAEPVNVAAAGAPTTMATPPPSTEVLKSDEVEVLEAVTLRRLRAMGVDTSMFE